MNLNRSTVPADTGRQPEQAFEQTRGSDYLERNREAWSRWATASAARGAEDWRAEQLRWGMWRSPESQLGLMTRLERGADVVELGCGSGALCGWLMRDGFRPVGVDFSPLQLTAAKRLQQENGLPFPL